MSHSKNVPGTKSPKRQTVLGDKMSWGKNVLSDKTFQGQNIQGRKSWNKMSFCDVSKHILHIIIVPIKNAENLPEICICCGTWKNRWILLSRQITANHNGARSDSTFSSSFCSNPKGNTSCSGWEQLHIQIPNKCEKKMIANYRCPRRMAANDTALATLDLETSILWRFCTHPRAHFKLVILMLTATT